MALLGFKARFAGLLLLGVLGAAVPSLASAADYRVPPRSVRVTEVDVRRPIIYRRWGCPDGYSCYPLYGAYGPYGGPAYWGAYTGWYR
jgi:hypothetical protein